MGGHCIPVDPHYLSWKMRTLNYKTRFIELASEVNSEMPYFIVDRVRDALKQQTKSVCGAEVFLFGVAYKRDVCDVRESPAMDVLKLLVEEGANVSYHDPFVPELEQEGFDLKSVEPTSELLASTDVAVILTAHSSIDYEWVVSQVRALVDARRVVPRDFGTGASWIVKG